MFNLNFDEIGCDFYSGSGHKWQCGPGRTGIAYVRNQGGNLPVIWVPEGSYSAGSQNRSDGDDIARLMQSHGNPNYPAYRALHDSCVYWDSIGRQDLQDYFFYLSTYTKERLLEVFDGTNLKLYCPNVPDLSSGLTTFNAFDDHQDFDKIYEFREILREEYDYIIRYTNFVLTEEENAAGGPQTYANRISTHLFHNTDEIDGLMEAMRDLHDRMTTGDLASRGKSKSLALAKTRKRDDIDDDNYC